MSVTKEELQSVTEKLSEKIDDKHEKMTAKWDGLADSINGLNVNIGKFLVKLDHQEQANKRISSDIGCIQKNLSSLETRFTIVETRQNVAVGFGGKLMMPAIYAMFALNAFVAVASYLSK